MVGQSRRKPAGQKLLGSHQRCWIWGRHAVGETLRAGKWRPLEVRLAERLPPADIDTARQWAAAQQVPILIEPAERLTQLCRSGEHQGYIARMPPFPYDTLDALLARAAAPAAVVMLDAVQDPYNFGAIIRTAEVLGMDGLVVGRTGQAEVSSLVARSSAGAVNHLPMARVDDLTAAADRLRRDGFRLVAASEKADQPLFACDFRPATVIVLGNEGAGIRPELLQRCDERVTIPQQGQVGSLNAAVAAGILLYEVRRQRHRGIDPSQPPQRSGNS